MTRLTDDQIDLLANGLSIGPDAVTSLAYEVQQWRALAPELIEQLETIQVDYGYSNYDGRRALDAIIAKLREASQ